MRSYRKIAGAALVVVGLSGLALTAMVAEDPAAAPEEHDALEPESPSLDTWVMGLCFSGLTATGVWLHRAARR